MREYSLRVWPNGEFGIGIVKKFTPTSAVSPQEADESNPFPLTPSGATAFYGSVTTAMNALMPGYYPAVLNEILRGELDPPLGSSNVPNSHKRSRRGSGGLTGYGKRMLRNGCFLLEQWAGKRNCAMVTCTLPPGPEGMEQAFSHQWAEIVRIFTQWVHRRLKAAGGCPWVIGCTEIQPERQARDGGLPLHLHIVFQARVKRVYTLSPAEVRDAWERACNACIPQSECLSFDASTRIEGVKKSVVNYLSKYVSKGTNVPDEELEAEGYKLPSSWWHGVGKFKKAIARMMVVTTGNDARMVHDATYDCPEMFIYVGKVYIGEESDARCVGWYGRMHRPLHRLMTENMIERRANQNVLVR